MIPKNKNIKIPRVKVIQKLYSSLMNPGIPVEFTKTQYKKFIKDVVNGTLERDELIEETIKKYLSNDINLKRTDKLLKIIIYAAVFELMFKHKNSINVIKDFSNHKPEYTSIVLKTQESIFRNLKYNFKKLKNVKLIHVGSKYYSDISVDSFNSPNNKLDKLNIWSTPAPKEKIIFKFVNFFKILSGKFHTKATSILSNLILSSIV